MKVLSNLELFFSRAVRVLDHYHEFAATVASIYKFYSIIGMKTIQHPFLFNALVHMLKMIF